MASIAILLFLIGGTHFKMGPEDQGAGTFLSFMLLGISGWYYYMIVNTMSIDNFYGIIICAITLISGIFTNKKSYKALVIASILWTLTVTCGTKIDAAMHYDLLCSILVILVLFKYRMLLEFGGLYLMAIHVAVITLFVGTVITLETRTMASLKSMFILFFPQQNKVLNPYYDLLKMLKRAEWSHETVTFLKGNMEFVKAIPTFLRTSLVYAGL